MNIRWLPLLILLLLPVSSNASGQPGIADGGRSAATGTHTPAKGSDERKAITHALRLVVKRMSGLDVVFVIRHLKINGNWAWVEAEPESADGNQHYEPLSGLFAWKRDRWVLLESPPEWSECEADPDCVDSSRYFKKVARKYPGLPSDIFPQH